MKAKTITYSRLISKGNFENEKIEITMEVEKGDKAFEVYNAAKDFVEKRVEAAKVTKQSLEYAQRILSDKRNHTIAQIEDANALMARAVVLDDKLPF
jgi:hypothetical protein